MLFLSLVIHPSVTAQPSSYGSPADNIGTWKWGIPAGSQEPASEEREPGETSWERLAAEREPAFTNPHSEEAPQTLSPLRLWRWFRGEKGGEE